MLHVRSRHRTALARSQPSASVTQLGLARERLDQLALEHDFADLAARYPSRGDEARLRQLAWLGSAFADAATPHDHPQREQVLREAALFNLAIALFDTVIDDVILEERAGLLRALHPDKLVLRLRDASPAASLCREAELRPRPLIRLFDAALCSIAQRFAGQPPSALDALASALEQMYISETEARYDRSSAKSLPIVFYSLLPDGGAREHTLAAFERLGVFVALLDDWKDLRSDVLAARANLWVSPRDGHGVVPVQYVARALCTMLRLLLAPAYAADVLEGAMQQAVALAAPDERDKIVACISLLRSGVDT